MSSEHAPENHPATAASAHRIARMRAWTAGAGVTMLVFGLLLWSRFLIATNHPKSAYADPNDVPAHAAASDPAADESVPDEDAEHDDSLEHAAVTP